MINRIALAFILIVIILGLPANAHALTSAAPASSPMNYYVSNSGNDSNPGTISAPWRTMQKAMDTLLPGDTLYVRGGQYNGIQTGWSFEYSGTETQPITVTNYPGEQVVFRILTAQYDDRYIFRCSVNPTTPDSWQTTKADHIRIIGTDVNSRVLSNGVRSNKGIVMQGVIAEQSSAIFASDCDHWEVAGVDFVEVAYGIFTKKNNWRTMEEHSPDYWYVHDNRVYNYYRESGMQFNGSFNRIENNEIYKVSNRLDTPYGCQLLNLLGNNNVVRGNTLGRLGSTADCIGILFEWDLADANLIENNTITEVPNAIAIYGGDGNIIQNNTLEGMGNSGAGVVIASYDDRTSWPCNEPDSISPPNNPAHSEYQYYYNPRNCHSMNNQIIGNTITGFDEGLGIQSVNDPSNIFADNEIIAATFDDVPFSHPYYQDIEVLYANGLTGGCSTSPLLFCPNTIMDRAQSAVFMLRGNFGINYNPPTVETGVFADNWSAGPWAKKWVEGLFTEGLTAGCSTNPLRYCPWDLTTREQAAVFALKLRYGNSYSPPPATGLLFADMADPDYWAAKWAEQAYNDGLLPDCGMDALSGRPLFCPKELVSRGLGAYMIVRAKNLTMP